MANVKEMARLLGSKGGKTTASRMTKAQRKDRAQAAAKARWAKAKPASDDHVTTSVVAPSSVNDAELAKRVCAALKSVRISHAVRAATKSRKKVGHA
jgi:hypothetical protein